MKNASQKSVPVLYKPRDAAYAEHIRKFQGCPTIATTKGGRIYLGWYAGGDGEPDMGNYNLVIYSDDGGTTWSELLLVIPSSKEDCIHALDIQLWTDPTGKLWVYWVQNDSLPDEGQEITALPGQPIKRHGGWIFQDFVHHGWAVVCAEPDADAPVFSQPIMKDIGFLRCKPLVTRTGRWIFFNYDQAEGAGLERYGYSFTDNEDKTRTHRYGAEKLSTDFDEAMAYQQQDGAIRMFARCNLGKLAQSVSYDNGETWEKASLSEITHAVSRCYVGRTPSGRVLLVVNDCQTGRSNLTLCLSDDDGKSWPYRKCIDSRESISYPDVDFIGNDICLTYDRERTKAKEIYFLRCTENDIIDPDTKIQAKMVSKP